MSGAVLYGTAPERRGADLNSALRVSGATQAGGAGAAKATSGSALASALGFPWKPGLPGPGRLALAQGAGPGGKGAACGLWRRGTPGLWAGGPMAERLGGS